ncbi:MAG: glyoxalase/bleomycin resistance/extradiol dioxygenase family protein [Comamonadaceae bacterium]|nr:MAG: glyoxalase/bleomycin resistance/extradiol dioxygenase family protein [Comamonadaceae bacterium]
MARQIFVNLPVKDLDKSVAFFTRLGFSFNPQFTDQNATCMLIGQDSFVMLLVEDFFKTFASKPVADARQTTEVLLAISCESRQQVDDMVSQALAAGGSAPRAAKDHGFMYQHGFDDLDGHAWEVMYMDATAMPPPA